MANNDEYTDEYNDEYLCRDFFVGFNFWSRLSFQISEFRVHWVQVDCQDILSPSLMQVVLTTSTKSADTICISSHFSTTLE